jgi:hypothetical protein
MHVILKMMMEIMLFLAHRKETKTRDLPSQHASADALHDHWSC